MTLEARI